MSDGRRAGPRECPGRGGALGVSWAGPGAGWGPGSVRGGAGSVLGGAWGGVGPWECQGRGRECPGRAVNGLGGGRPLFLGVWPSPSWVTASLGSNPTGVQTTCSAHAGRLHSSCLSPWGPWDPLSRPCQQQLPTWCPRVALGRFLQHSHSHLCPVFVWRSVTSSL